MDDSSDSYQRHRHPHGRLKVDDGGSPEQEQQCGSPSTTSRLALSETINVVELFDPAATSPAERTSEYVCTSSAPSIASIAPSSPREIIDPEVLARLSAAALPLRRGPVSSSTSSHSETSSEVAAILAPLRRGAVSAFTSTLFE